MSIRIFGLPIFLSVFSPYMAYSTGFAFRNLSAGASRPRPVILKKLFPLTLARISAHAPAMLMVLVAVALPGSSNDPRVSAR